MSACATTSGPSHFLLARSMAPGLVTAADSSSSTATARRSIRQAATLYLERFIHSEIYKAHPDVTRGRAQPFAGGHPVRRHRVRLRPIFHMSVLPRRRGVPVFEIRDAGGPATDMLIRTPELGAALARRSAAPRWR